MHQYDYDLNMFNFESYSLQEMVDLFNKKPQSIRFNERSAIVIETGIADASFKGSYKKVSDEELHIVKLYQFKIQHPKLYQKLMKFLSDHENGVNTAPIKIVPKNIPQENKAQRNNGAGYYSFRQCFFAAGLALTVVAAVATHIYTEATSLNKR